ncbi:MAG: Gfo/Idh/MocA family oxidoreductase [Legionellaceae bacterium]|nr:Gfo/Idh/MocA family oxidoreductase [Legionellaceae bacterium]
MEGILFVLQYNVIILWQLSFTRKKAEKRDWQLFVNLWRSNSINILLIGYGSIGKKHYSILSSQSQVKTVDLVTRCKIDGIRSFSSLDELTQKQLDDYHIFWICTPTHQHIRNLEYIDMRVNKKLIVVEKPLFDKGIFYTPNNKVVVAYNLRFHPVIQQLKSLLLEQKILTYSVRVGQYLPFWRPDQDYRLSYSADRTKGGGVLRDLSHELDYTMMFCGPLHVVGAVSSKLSNLAINSDDVCTILCKNNQGAAIIIYLDYLSFQTKRQIDIQTNSMTISADLISNKIVVNAINFQKAYDFSEYDKNYSYIQMHKNILEHNFCEISSYTEACQVMNLIDFISNKYTELS